MLPTTENIMCKKVYVEMTYESLNTPTTKDSSSTSCYEHIFCVLPAAYPVHHPSPRLTSVTSAEINKRYIFQRRFSNYLIKIQLNVNDSSTCNVIAVKFWLHISSIVEELVITNITSSIETRD